MHTPNNTNCPGELCDLEADCSPDCNTNGIADFRDIANGTSQDRNNNSVPDECEGCTLTQGYWKNHGDYSDPALVQPCLDRAITLHAQCLDLAVTSDQCTDFTMFFALVCENLDDNFATSYPNGPIKGDPCVILSRQFFAFVMNTFFSKGVGASVPDSLLEQLVTFHALHPTVLDATTCDSDAFTQVFSVLVKQLAKQLDLYNTGEYPDGPEHCESEPECGYFNYTVTDYHYQPTPGEGCAVATDLQLTSEAGECVSNAIQLGADLSYKINCLGQNMARVTFSRRSNCGGKDKRTLDVVEGTCLVVLNEADPTGDRLFGEIRCSGCEMPELAEVAIVPLASTTDACVRSSAYWRRNVPSDYAPELCDRTSHQLLQSYFSVRDVSKNLAQQAVSAYLNAHSLATNPHHLSESAFMSAEVYNCFSWAYYQELPRCNSYYSGDTGFDLALQCSELLAEFNEGYQNLQNCDTESDSSASSLLRQTLESEKITPLSASVYEVQSHSTGEIIAIVLGVIFGVILLIVLIAVCLSCCRQ